MKPSDLMTAQPVTFTWKELDICAEGGEIIRQMAMVPLPRYSNIAKRQFTAGEEYTLAPVTERSMASHRQFFAAINDGFHNLPEKISARFPTAEHLRKWLLTETSWFDEKEFDLISEKHAKALATFIRTEDSYARITLHGTKVIVRRAKSQSLSAMGKDDFQRSKQDVLDLLEHMIGVPKGKLMQEANKHA